MLVSITPVLVFEYVLAVMGALILSGAFLTVVAVLGFALLGGGNEKRK